MKKTVSEHEMNKLVEANDSVRGTNDYMKYHMMAEYKTKRDGKWSKWNFLSWGVPVPFDMTVKKVGENVFLMREGVNCMGEEEITRYTLTESVNQILNVV